MSAAKFTPGQWYAREWSTRAATTVLVDDESANILGKRLIAECERKEDAMLIAAAPEMLAELREAREYVQAQRDCLANSHRNPVTGKLHPADVCVEDDALLARLDAVIAKAQGAA